MDGVLFLRGQLRQAHGSLEAAMDGLTHEQAAWLPPGKAQPVGAAYARVLILEDATVNAFLKGDKPLFSTTWDNRVGEIDCLKRLRETPPGG